MFSRTITWAVPGAAVLALSGLALATTANAAPTATAVTSPAAITAAISTGSVTASTQAPVLRTGSRGAAVRGWQIDIDRTADKVSSLPHIAKDGIFGPRTAAATRAFQRYAHIRVDGIVGPQTRAAMDTALHGSP